jgi:phosphoglycerate dehydrogenase-like enzyme
VQKSALIAVLDQERIAGAGLDINHSPWADKGPLTWKGTAKLRAHSRLSPARETNDLNVVVNAPSVEVVFPGGPDRQWRLFRENIRRFVAGEALLGVVDKEKGF